MRLNFNKCINLTINRKQSSIRFSDGSPVPRKHHAKYLGTLLTDSVDNGAEVTSRINDVLGTCAKTKSFWNKAQTTVKWKLRVYDSVIKSKLLYGLETIQLTGNEQSRLDAFQMKGYRRILGIPPTHIDRSWTNERVRRELVHEHNFKYTSFSDTWQKRKVTLLGHIIRSHRYDPLRQVLFEKSTLIPRIELTRRVGRPKGNWLVETYKDAWALCHLTEAFDFANPTHRNKINNAAETRS